MNAPRRDDVSHCRSCRARIVWAKTPTGATMPVDASPAADGDHVLYPGPQGWLVLRVHEHADADRPHYKSHFATCPNAGAHRRERPKGART
jgi:hypothetical protein